MADPKGFLKVTERELPKRRPVPVRIMDWKEVYEQGDPPSCAGRPAAAWTAASRSAIRLPARQPDPEWNDLMWRGEGRAAIERLHATNNFPEFTGGSARPRASPRACSPSTSPPSRSSRSRSRSSTRRSATAGCSRSRPGPPDGQDRRGRRLRAGRLAAAQQLTRAGHTVAVYERDDRIGGLLRYGIPDFKMEKKHLDRASRR